MHQLLGLLHVQRRNRLKAKIGHDPVMLIERSLSLGIPDEKNLR